VFGGYRNAKKEGRRKCTESPLTNKVHVAMAKARLQEETQYVELPRDRKESVSQADGDTEEGTDEDSEVSFEEMLKREKKLEMKLKNKA
jgi:hypothetical protein